MERTGPVKEREEVIRKYATLVKIIASRLAMRLPAHVDMDDLINVGIAGLLEAIDRYDPSRGVKIETYLSIRIRGAMLDELRRMDWVPRSVRQKRREVEEAYIKLESTLNREPTEEELAEYLGMDSEEYQRFLQESSCLAFISLEDLGLQDGDEERSILECIGDPKAVDPFSQLNFKEVKELLARAIEELPEKERLVLSLYYYEDLNLKEIGKILEVSESRVSQIHSQAILRLKAKLRKVKKALL